jgi:uncharacterized membrane protein
VTDSSIPPAVNQNIQAIEAYYAREEQRVRPAQRVLERLSAALGRPWFLITIMAFVSCWIAWNLIASRFGMQPFDPPPFAALEGIVSLIALLVTSILLTGQNRLAQLERRREQLALQVNILTEQKTTKLVTLIEELRRDLPMVRDRHDPDAASLQQPTDATSILNALEQRQGQDPTD